MAERVDAERELERLREGLRERGHLVGRDPEGRDNAVDLALMLADDLREAEEKWAQTDTREALRQARDDLADIGRHHTRAIHALAGRVEYPPDERADTGRRLTAALARIDAALAASSSQERRRGVPDQSSTPDAREMQRVAGRCPSCGRETLFLGAGGYVTCSLLGCEDPNRAQRMLEQLSEVS